MTDKSGEVIELAEKADRYKTIRFSWGDISYVFGAECYVEFEDKDGDMVQKVFARNVWPREVYEHVDDQEFGVRFEYVSQTHAWCHGIMSSAAFIDKATARRACADASGEGVDVEAGSEHHLAYAFGRWRKAMSDVEIVKMTDSPGWKKQNRVFVNGENVFGHKAWHADESHMRIKRRSQRAGELSDWVDAVDSEVITPALRASLGVSLAGPLIGLLRTNPFILHIYGNSSCGKSTAGRVAASVWSAPDEQNNGLFHTWKNSLGGFELLAASADGACLVLDELGTFSGTDRQFADLVHMLTAKSGKVTMTQVRNERETNTWAITGVSTGEVSMKARIGDYLQGGQMVRMVDLDVEPGDVTIDAMHADRVRRKFMGAYGMAGDAWVDYLVDLGPQAIELADEWIAHWRNMLRAHEDGTAEGGRILSHIHLIGAAIGLARAAKLIPWPADEDVEMLNWLAQRVMGDREGSKTPNERALDMWYSMIDSEPGCFPNESDTGPRNFVYGYIKPGDPIPDQKEIWVCESLLKKSGLPTKSGVTPRKWLQWCVENKYCRDAYDERCIGKKRGWKVFPIDLVQK